MNTPKHTPGPWVIRYTDAVYAQSGRFIADCELTPYDARPQPPNSTDAANAHFIAAAPAMYQAGCLSLDVMERVAMALERMGNEGLRSIVRSAVIEQKAALAQAEGRG